MGEHDEDKNSPLQSLGLPHYWGLVVCSAFFLSCFRAVIIGIRVVLDSIGLDGGVCRSSVLFGKVIMGV